MAEKSIDIKVRAKDEATGVFKKVGNSLESLKGSFGKRSDLDEVVDVLKGGGALAAISEIGQILGKMADKTQKWRAELAEGKIDAAGVVEELAKSIPVYGHVIDAGRKWRAILDGSAEEPSQINEEIKLSEAL